MVGAEADLVLGEDHPGGDLAAHLAPVEREAVREHGAGQCHRDGRPDAEVPGAADDRARLGVAGVDLRELEPVGVRMLGRLDDAPDLELAEIAVLVRDAAVLDPFDLGRRDRKPFRELLERHAHRDVVLQPGDRDPHQWSPPRQRSPAGERKASETRTQGVPVHEMYGCD